MLRTSGPALAAECTTLQVSVTKQQFAVVLAHRDPLKKAPEQMPGEQPARRGDEQTQPQPGEASASTAASEEEKRVDISAE